MSVQHEEIQLRIVASGNAAKKELADLGMAQTDLKRKIEGLNKGTKDYTATKRKLETELKSVNVRMRKLRSEIDLNSMSTRDLRNRVRDLDRAMENLNPDSAEWKRLNTQLTATKSRMAELRGSSRQLQGTWGNMMSAMKGGIMAYAGIEGIRALWNGAKDAVAAYTKQAQAVAKVNQAITSTGGAAGLSLSQLRNEASQLQKKTLFGDETILNDATAQLLTFTNIAQDNFLRTQRVALDLSTVLDGDLKSASIQLGKALNDPVANLSALSRSGIQFSKAQKEVIKSLAESGRLAEAQGVILDELEKQYGGQAETAAKVGGGWKQLGNIIGDTSEEIGGLITAIFNTDAATGGLIEIISNLNEKIREWGEGVIQARKWMRDWYDESAVLRGAIQFLTAGIKANVMWVVQFLDQAIVKPIQGIIAGVKATRLAMQGEFKQAGNVLKAHYNAVVDDWKEFGSDMKNVYTDAIEEVKNPAPWKALEENSTKAVKKATEEIEIAKQALTEFNALLAKGGKDSVGSFDEYLASDTEDADSPSTMPADDPKMQEWLDAKAEFEEYLAEIRRTAKEQELYEEEQYWDEMMQLNQDFFAGATDLEERKRAAMAAINAKWDAQELEAVRQQENAKTEIKRESFQSAAKMSSQFLGFIGDYMEKGSAAQIATASTQIGIDTAMSVSSAIKGATEAAAAGGPTAPFLMLTYITSMVASVYSAFSQISGLVESAKAAKTDTDISVPQFAQGTKGSTVTPAGWKLVGEEGPELINTPGGDKIITAPDTAAILRKYNMGQVSGMPVPRFSVDTNAINKSVQQMVPSFASGTAGAASGFGISGGGASSAMGDQSALINQMERLIQAVKEEKARPAIVSQRQLKDKEADITYIRGFSDIRKAS